LGWVPFKAANLKRKGRAVRFCGKTLRVFEPERLEGVQWKQGHFAQDAVGDWWLSLPIAVQVDDSVAPLEKVGIDLGLKEIAVTSDDARCEKGRFYRDIERKIAQAQRRGHRRQAKYLHRRAANRRKDALHKFSRQIVDQYQKIVVGDVSSTKTGEDTDGEVRAGCRMGHAQKVSAIQKPAGGQNLPDRQRKKLQPHLFEL